MDGVTDLSFRRLIRKLSGKNAPLFVSEFITTPIDKKAARFDKEEEPFCIQLFGKNAEELGIAALQAQELGAAFVELNAGCPAKKVAGKGSGSGLLRDLPNLRKILVSMKDALCRDTMHCVSTQLYLKCRLGWDKDSIVINEVLQIAEDCGVEQLTIHGRTKEQAYTGIADWNAIGEIAAKAKIPIIGNGDITSVQMANDYAKKYGVAGVAIGRAALQNPWIFSGLRPSRDDVYNMVKLYAEIMRDDTMYEGQILGRLKQMCSRLLHGDFRLNVLRSQNINEFFENLSFIHSSKSSLVSFL